MDNYYCTCRCKLPYGAKVLRGRILTNGVCMKFDKQSFDQSTVVFIGKAKGYKDKF